MRPHTCPPKPGRRRTLRTDLTLSYAGVLGLLLTALGFTYYHVVARQLDVDATGELAEKRSK